MRNLSENTKAKLKQQAQHQGRSLEGYVRGILEQTAERPVDPSTRGFPHNLIALVEPGEALDPLLQTHDHAQEPVEL